jgi:hypothetical protein
MTEQQFWFGDIRLIRVYQKAYYRNISYIAHTQGNITMIAVEKGARNALASKKKDIDRTWGEYKDPFEKFNKPKITIENLEEEFRKQQYEQQSWLFNR